MTNNTVYQNILADAYTTKLAYPAKAAFQKYHVYHNGKVIVDKIDATAVTAEMKRDWKENGYTVEISTDLVAFAAATNAYSDDDFRLMKLFQSDLADEFGVEHNTKRDLLYSKAWERGHASGLSEVYNSYLDLVDLIK